MWCPVLYWWFPLTNQLPAIFSHHRLNLLGTSTEVTGEKYQVLSTMEKPSEWSRIKLYHTAESWMWHHGAPLHIHYPWASTGFLASVLYWWLKTFLYLTLWQQRLVPRSLFHVSGWPTCLIPPLLLYPALHLGTIWPKIRKSPISVHPKCHIVTG